MIGDGEERSRIEEVIAKDAILGDRIDLKGEVEPRFEIL